MTTGPEPGDGAQAADRLAALAESRGEPVTGGGNRPVDLSDPGVVCFVAEGSVDVFAARRRPDGTTADFKHFLRAGAGRLLFGAAENLSGAVLVVKGLPGSALRLMPLDTLDGAGCDELVAAQVETWVSGVSEAVTRDFTYRPSIDLLVSAEVAEQPTEAGQTVSARRGVVWLSSEEGGLAYLGTEEVDPDARGAVPVTSTGWVTASEQASVRCATTLELHRQGRLMSALAAFNDLALSADDLNRRLLLVDVANLRTSTAEYRRKGEENARRRLFGVLDPAAGRDADAPALPEALQLIGRHERIAFRMPPGGSQRSGSAAEAPTLAGVLMASGVRMRRVALRPEQRWWRGNSGAMLGVGRDDGAPVALVPGPLGRYRMAEPSSGRLRRVNARRAESLEREAHFFYSPLPEDGPVGVGRLSRLAFHRVRPDLLRMVGAGMLAGMAMLVPAVLLGAFAEQALPSGSLQVLGTLTLGAVLVALLLGVLLMIQGTALMRLEGRVAARAGAALWHRMLDLPSGFFRRFTAGNLATRAMAFHDLRDQVSGLVAGAFLSVLFLLPTFALIFLYNTALGWLCLGLGLASLGVTLMLGLRQTPHHRRRLAVTRDLAGTLLQLIGGVSKLRSAGAEGAAYTMWAKGYRQQKQTEMKLGTYQEHLTAFTAAVPLFAAAALFALALRIGGDGLAVGGFLAVYAAFMVFNTAVVQFGAAFSGVAAIRPAVQQVRPILAERPRNLAADLPAPELKGEVLLDRVSFRYSEDGPLTLNDVTIHAQPGEFIALVGESGAGKSTVFRLALGLEKPSLGAVYFDGHDLSRLNWSSVRNLIGTVPQDAHLRPQTVMDNIIGIDGDLTEDDAWRAAGLAEVHEDIAAMPMQMYTVSSESAAAFSGGQVQRFMLAAALAREPKVLLLDEATNWLDNRTQANIMEQIERLSVTRIVSAHRLSTIRRADRIYVLADGRVAQEGTFEALVEQEGLFQDLVTRQMTEPPA
jgi:NHLM bacteriocin system ABC transporter ATP-binding protein